MIINSQDPDLINLADLSRTVGLLIQAGQIQAAEDILEGAKHCWKAQERSTVLEKAEHRLVNAIFQGGIITQSDIDTFMQSLCMDK